MDAGHDEQTDEAEVLQVLEGGYSSYVAGGLWSFASAGRSRDTGLAADVNYKLSVHC